MEAIVFVASEGEADQLLLINFIVYVVETFRTRDAFS